MGSKGCSVVDYVVCSANLLQYVKTFYVADPNILSDHCLIEFSFCFGNCPPLPEPPSYSNEQTDYKYTWNNDSKDRYVERLESEKCMPFLNDLTIRIDDAQTDSEINNCLSQYDDIMGKVASPLSKRKCRRYGYQSTERPVYNRWFNNDCERTRSLFINL